MKIGICAMPQDWQTVAACGYDYAEGNLSWLAGCSEEELRAAKEAHIAAGLDIPCFNGFFPGGIRLYDMQPEDIRTYTERALSRAAALGGRIAVLGSGGARQVPPGMEREEATRRFVDILRLCGEVAAVHGMKIAIEPLNYREDTLINTAEDALAVCRMVDHPAVGMLIDLYHFRENGEDITALPTLPDLSRYLLHVHLARPDSDRGAPTMTDVGAMEPWVEALRKIGYRERISLECIFRPNLKTAIREAYPVLDEFRAL